MRHRVGGRKLGLPSDQRKALLKGLVRSLFLNDKIVTTETRAKEIKPIAEKLITTARQNTIHARRLVRTYIDSNLPEFGYASVKNAKGKTVQKPERNPDYVVPRLFEEIAPRYKNRPGGYTRITKIGFRRGDAAPMVLIELVEGDIVPAAPAAAAAETADKPKRSRTKKTE
jgi:large subunit ribosomal protein L17